MIPQDSYYLYYHYHYHYYHYYYHYYYALEDFNPQRDLRDSSKGGAVETGCSGLHDITGRFMT